MSLECEDEYDGRDRPLHGHPSLSSAGQDQDLFSAPPEKWIPIYGFQGAVMFNIYDKYSLMDAVVRLAGPQPCLNLAIYSHKKVGANEASSVIQHVEHVDMQKNDHSELIRRLFAPLGSEQQQAVFVYAGGETAPPYGQWKPPRNADTDDDVIVRCSRNEHSGHEDVAYLRLPANAAHLRHNQYFRWLIVVARILTPGSGLRALRLDDLGVVAHSVISFSGSSHGSLQSHGAAGFSRWHWRELVDAVKQGGRVWHLDVTPLDRTQLAVTLPGYHCGLGQHDRAAQAQNEDEEQSSSMLVQLQSDVGHAHSTQNQAKVADCINSIVDAATTAAEKRFLAGVNVWGSGVSWENAYVTQDSYPLTSECIDFPTDKSLCAGVVVVRPTYGLYTARVVAEDGSGILHFRFSLDGTLGDFRDCLRRAGLGQLSGSCLRISQQGPQRSLQLEAGDEGKCNNRMEMNLEPNASQDDWVVICSLIVGPEIWITRVSDECILRAPDSAQQIWGYRETYGNLDSASTHAESSKENSKTGTVLSAEATPTGRAAASPWMPQTKKVSFFDNLGPMSSRLRGGIPQAMQQHLLPRPVPLLGGQARRVNRKSNAPSTSAKTGKTGHSSLLWAEPAALPFAVSRGIATPREAAELESMTSDLYDLAVRRQSPLPHEKHARKKSTRSHTDQTKRCPFCHYDFHAHASPSAIVSHIHQQHLAILKDDGPAGTGMASGVMPIRGGLSTTTGHHLVGGESAAVTESQVEEILYEYFPAKKEGVASRRFTKTVNGEIVSQKQDDLLGSHPHTLYSLPKFVFLIKTVVATEPATENKPAMKTVKKTVNERVVMQGEADIVEDPRAMNVAYCFKWYDSTFSTSVEMKPATKKTPRMLKIAVKVGDKTVLRTAAALLDDGRNSVSKAASLPPSKSHQTANDKLASLTIAEDVDEEIVSHQIGSTIIDSRALAELSSLLWNRDPIIHSIENTQNNGKALSGSALGDGDSDTTDSDADLFLTVSDLESNSDSDSDPDHSDNVELDADFKLDEEDEDSDEYDGGGEEDEEEELERRKRKRRNGMDPSYHPTRRELKEDEEDDELLEVAGDSKKRKRRQGDQKTEKQKGSRISPAEKDRRKTEKELLRLVDRINKKIKARRAHMGKTLDRIQRERAKAIKLFRKATADEFIPPEPNPVMIPAQAAPRSFPEPVRKIATPTTTTATATATQPSAPKATASKPTAPKRGKDKSPAGEGMATRRSTRLRKTSE